MIKSDEKQHLFVDCRLEPSSPYYRLRLHMRGALFLVQLWEHEPSSKEVREWFESMIDLAVERYEKDPRGFDDSD